MLLSLYYCSNADSEFNVIHRNVIMAISSNNRLTQLLLNRFKIDVSKFNELFLSSTILKALTQNSCQTENELCDLISSNEHVANAFIESLHINYSEFFRNSLTFAVLESIILPSMAIKMKSNKQTEVRIWSAASASGHEPYSIAMLFEEFNARNSIHLNYRIFATDQCPNIIELARKGEFSQHSVNNLSIKRLNQWFTQNGSTYKVHEALQKHIDFSVFDLLSETENAPPKSIFGNFDILICSNILFYYKTEYRKIIANKIDRTLSKSGYLITGETERDFFIENGYNEIFQQSAIFQK